MESFHYMDFVTDLPIIKNYGLDLSNGEDEEELKVLFICADEMVFRAEQEHALTPIAYPMFGYYDDYGRFKLADSNPDSMFSKANKLAVDLIDQGVVVDGRIDAVSLLDEDKFINATSYKLYKSAIESTDGEPADLVTHKEAFDERVKEFEKYMKNENYRTNLPAVPFILNTSKGIFSPSSGSQKKLYEAIKDEDLYNYLLDWDIFEDFLIDNYKIFKHPYQIGRQDVMLKFMRILKDLEMAELEKLEDERSYQFDEVERIIRHIK